MRVHKRFLVAIPFLFSVATGWGFDVRDWQGSLDLGFEWGEQVTTFPAGLNSRLEISRLDQKLILKNSSFLIDPRFLTLDSSFSLGFFQDRISGNAGTSPSHGELLGYDLTASILREKPLATTFFANRTRNIITREFAGRTDVLTENRGITLTLREGFLPSTLSYRELFLREESRFGGFNGGREELRNVFSYDGRNTWNSNDLYLRYELADVKDQIRPEMDFRTSTSNISHRINFGEKGGGMLNSSVRSFRRDGRFDTLLLNADQSLNLRHSESFSTAYQVGVARSRVDERDSDSISGNFTLEHKLYESLRTVFNLSQTSTSFPSGEETRARTWLDLHYTKKVPLSGKIISRLGGTYEIQDNQGGEELTIFAESHIAEIGIPFRLNRIGAIPGRIVVTDLSRTTIFQEGIDYFVLQIGDFVEIDTIPSGIILDGQTVLVDYDIMARSVRRFTTQANRFSFGVDYSWIYPYFSIDRVEQDPGPGMDNDFLENLTERTAGLRFRWDRPAFRATLRNEFRDRKSNRLAFRSLRFDQMLTTKPIPTITLTFSLRENFSDFFLPHRETKSFTGRVGFSWKPRSRFFLDGSFSGRKWQDTIAPDENIYDASLKARWSIGKFQIGPGITYNVREREASKANDLRLTLRVTRGF